MDRGLAIQSGTSKTIDKIVGVRTKMWVASMRPPSGHLVGKVKTARKGADHPNSQCRWPSTVKAQSLQSTTVELLRDITLLYFIVLIFFFRFLLR
jgi:hypothetical protein